MKRTAPVEHPVHELIAERWSPRAFSERLVERSTLLSLLEAARWAPSSYNEQPWSFLIATHQEPEDYERLLSCLVPFNQEWAHHAPVLMISLARLTFDRNQKPNRHALHDVGLAVSQLTLEATARGMVVHQMAGFDLDRAREVGSIPEDWEPVAAIALGYPGSLETLTPAMREREGTPRNRRPLSEIAFAGTWGRPF